LIPDKTIPWTKERWATTNSTISGMVATAAPA
jgi:hypothetical protein